MPAALPLDSLAVDDELAQATVASASPAHRLSAANSGTSAELADWARERKRFWEWAPSRSLLASLRAYQRHATARAPWSVFLKRLCVVRHRFWSAVTGADIPLNSRIGGGLVMIHPNGIVIHPRAVIGPNCKIFQQVTIGTADSEDVPTLGANVEIGAGARLLGGIVIGEHARIGANAVVLTDVPAGATAVGVPARIARIRPLSDSGISGQPTAGRESSYGGRTPE
jgi:serine O-acetyltransferase